MNGPTQAIAGLPLLLLPRAPGSHLYHLTFKGIKSSPLSCPRAKLTLKNLRKWLPEHVAKETRLFRIAVRIGTDTTNCSVLLKADCVKQEVTELAETGGAGRLPRTVGNTSAFGRMRQRMGQPLVTQSLHPGRRRPLIHVNLLLLKPLLWSDHKKEKGSVPQNARFKIGLRFRSGNMRFCGTDPCYVVPDNHQLDMNIKLHSILWTTGVARQIAGAGAWHANGRSTVMLQIITGRFFQGAECHITDRKAVLFSNYHWVRTIDSAAGAFEPVSTGVGTTWIWSYRHRHPKSPGGFSVVETGRDEVLDQFRCFAIFALRAYFAFRQRDVEHLCRIGPTGQADVSPPSAYTPRLFESQIHGLQEEADQFPKLLEKLLKLPRDKYRAARAVLRAFRDAVEALDTNVDLAYSILVYALESLAQGFDQFTPSWDLYEQPVREELDAILQEVPEKKAAAIRAALLNAVHMRLRARFVAFCRAHVTDDYFVTEARGVEAALRESELEHTLGNAYDLRSKYVHELQPIVHQLRHPTFSRTDTFRFDNAAYLTVSGLLRLTRHIVTQFIIRGETLESEEVNWREELPGSIKIKLAPEYWIGSPAAFTPKRSAEYLTEFMSYMLTTVLPQKKMVTMLPLVEKLEADFRTCKSEFKLPLLCLYWAYNASAIIPEEARRPKWAEFLKPHASILDECHMYTMATRVFVGHELEWPLRSCMEAISRYEKKRFKWVQLPIRVEAAVFAAVANKAWAEGNAQAAEGLLNTSILNTAGSEVQKTLMEARVGKRAVDVDVVLGWANGGHEEK